MFESKDQFRKALFIGILFLFYALPGNHSVHADARSVFFEDYTRKWLEWSQPIEMEMRSTLQLSLKASRASIGKLREENRWYDATFDVNSPVFGAKYSSSDPEVAEITDKGLIIARSMGEAKVRAELGKRVTECPVVVYSLDKYGRRATQEKKVIPKPDLSKIKGSSMKFLGLEYALGNELTLYEGDRYLLRVNGRFSGNAASGDITYELTGSRFGTSYSSSDPTVALVSGDGTLEALSAGRAEITARNGLDRSAARILSVAVHNEEDFYPKPDLSKLPSMRLIETIAIIDYKDNYAPTGPLRNFDLSLAVGDKCILPVIGNFYSEDPSRSREYYNLTGARFGTVYSSDDPSVAAVSDDGRLWALSPGLAKVTADNIFKERKTQSLITWYVEVRR
jgi:hypothetical protein